MFLTNSPSINIDKNPLVFLNNSGTNNTTTILLIKNAKGAPLALKRYIKITLNTGLNIKPKKENTTSKFNFSLFSSHIDLIDVIYGKTNDNEYILSRVADCI